MKTKFALLFLYLFPFGNFTFSQDSKGNTSDSKEILKLDQAEEIELDPQDKIEGLLLNFDTKSALAYANIYVLHKNKGTIPMKVVISH